MSSKSRSRASACCATRSSGKTCRAIDTFALAPGARRTVSGAVGLGWEAGEGLRRQAVEGGDRELEMLALRVLELRVREAPQALDEEHHRRHARARDLRGVM